MFSVGRERVKCLRVIVVNTFVGVDTIFIDLSLMLLAKKLSTFQPDGIKHMWVSSRMISLQQIGLPCSLQVIR
jgi:hypothetical protein